jgi:hypothetical protein
VCVHVCACERTATRITHMCVCCARDDTAHAQARADLLAMQFDRVAMKAQNDNSWSGLLWCEARRECARVCA